MYFSNTYIASHWFFLLDTVCFAKSSYRVLEGERLEMELIVNRRLTTSINVQLRYDNSHTASSK